MNFVQKYFLYKKIMGRSPNMVQMNDYVALGLYVRDWTIDGIKCRSIYDRERGYTAIVHLAGVKRVVFDGIRALKIYGHVSR